MTIQEQTRQRERAGLKLEQLSLQQIARLPTTELRVLAMKLRFEVPDPVEPDDGH